MHAYFVRDFFEREGFHIFDALLHEHALRVHNGLGGLADGVLASFNIANQPARRVQMLADIGAFVRRDFLTAHVLDVRAVDGEGGHVVGREHDDEIVIHFLDDNFRLDIGGRLAAVFATRVGIEPGEHLLEFHDSFGRNFHGRSDFRDASLHQRGPMFADECSQVVFVGVFEFNLQQQAFTNIGGANAGRFKFLDHLEDRRHLDLINVHLLGNLGEIAGKKAVCVYIANDNALANLVGAGRFRGDAQLVEQTRAKRFAARDGILVILPDVFGISVSRQVIAFPMPVRRVP